MPPAIDSCMQVQVGQRAQPCVLGRVDHEQLTAMKWRTCESRVWIATRDIDGFDVVKGYRKIYFLRRSIAPLVEFAGAIEVLINDQNSIRSRSNSVQIFNSICGQIGDADRGAFQPPVVRPITGDSPLNRNF